MSAVRAPSSTLNEALSNLKAQVETRLPAQREDPWERQQREEEARRQQQRRERMVAASGLEGRFFDATFDTFVATSTAQRTALAACRAFVTEILRRRAERAERLRVAEGKAAVLDVVRDSRKERQGNLWLLGPVGTGKTHLGSAIVSEALAADESATIVSPRAMVRRIRATWTKGAEEDESTVIDSLAAAAILVLDEVGVGFGSDAEKLHLFDVVDRRYVDGYPTVVVSNLNAEQIREAVGERTFDRMRENATIVVCDWPSFRKPADTSRACRARARDSG